MANRSTEHVSQINSTVSISITLTLLRDESGPMPEDENEPRSTLEAAHILPFAFGCVRGVDSREMMRIIDLET